MASVGSGKSLMLGEVLKLFDKLNKRALCLVNNSELVRNNAETFKKQGGNPSIYSSALKQKCYKNNVIFATPQTVLNAIKKNKGISRIKFNIILVDEAHAINYKDHRTVYMRVLRHYKTEYPQMRILGATGTNFRFKSEPIVGEDCFFRKQVGNITTHWLIENGYLVKPRFEIDKDFQIDFSSVRLNKMGQFDSKQLDKVIQDNERLTAVILKRLQAIMEAQNRFGCFVFCSTIKHCHEAFKSLPRDVTAMITGKTPERERQVILEKARRGEIKYLINVQVLTVGIDVPGYDTLLFLRPTESLVLAVQMIGRSLRLYSGKESALILDCAGNLERHRDWDDPIIDDAIKQIEEQNNIDDPFQCPECGYWNSQFARRCAGRKDKKRCDYYFVFKECPECYVQNDITARQCRECEFELLDPNRNLNGDVLISDMADVTTMQTKIVYHPDYIQFGARFVCESRTNQQKIWIDESFTPTTEKARNYFYFNFVKHHVKDSWKYYRKLNTMGVLEEIQKNIMQPNRLLLTKRLDQWIIKERYFDDVLCDA